MPAAIDEAKRELGETLDLVKRYFKQETLGPLKSLQRTLAYGVGGGIALAAGLVLLDIAALRALQEETGKVFAKHWTWVPGTIAAVLALVLIGLTVGAMARAMKRSAGRPEAQGRQAAAPKSDKETTAA